MGQTFSKTLVGEEFEPEPRQRCDPHEGGRRCEEICGYRRVAFALLALSVVALAGADTIGPTTFESPAYTAGNINSQNGWKNTGPYDSAVALVSSFAAASGYGFGAQSLRISNAVTSQGFGDQTIAPGVTSPAGESTSNKHFEATFSIGTTLATQQPGLALTVAPDDGTGSRMSNLQFVDQADGVHVIFTDVTDTVLLPKAATFNNVDIATLSRTTAHTIRFSIDFAPGAGNDVVRIYIDGVLKHTGTSWEDYYRFDPEQTGNGNVVPKTSTLIFLARGTAAGTPGNGYLIDGVTIASSNGNGNGNAASSKALCMKGGWKTFTSPKFKNQGQCIKAANQAAHAAAGKSNNGKSDSNSKGNGKDD